VRRILILATLAMLPALLNSGPVAPAQQKPPLVVVQQAATEKPGAFAGAETCALCHADIAKKFSSNPHSELALLHGVRGSTTVLSDWGPTKDFMDAPTQYASIGANYTPNKKLRLAAGYRISAVSGNQFFADAQKVNGSLQSGYQSPYLNAAWTARPGWVWRAEYNYYGYGEGGPSGAPFCSNSTSVTSVVVPCNSATLTGPTGLTEPSSGLSAPRNMHANILTLAMHYEF